MYLCNACNRRNQKLHSLLRSHPNMATAWKDKTKEEKEEIKEQLNNVTNNSEMKNKMVAAFATQEIKKTSDVQVLRCRSNRVSSVCPC